MTHVKVNVYQVCSNKIPWLKIGTVQLIFVYMYIVKTFKNPNSWNLDIKHLLVSVNQVCSNKSPGVKIGLPRGHYLPYMPIVKTKQKSSFKRPKRARA
jgi:hypothetical protein